MTRARLDSAGRGLIRQGLAGVDGHGRMRHGLDQRGWGRLGVAGKIELLWGVNPKQLSKK